MLICSIQRLTPEYRTRPGSTTAAPVTGFLPQAQHAPAGEDASIVGPETEG
jgi:hypothetical protein